jgi:hypothetical protein
MDLCKIVYRNYEFRPEIISKNEENIVSNTSG